MDQLIGHVTERSTANYKSCFGAETTLLTERGTKVKCIFAEYMLAIIKKNQVATANK